MGLFDEKNAALGKARRSLRDSSGHGPDWPGTCGGGRQFRSTQEHERGECLHNEQLAHVLGVRLDEAAAAAAERLVGWGEDLVHGVPGGLHSAGLMAGIRSAWIVQNDVLLRTVCELLRHKDIATTMRDAHLVPEQVREAVTALEWS